MQLPGKDGKLLAWILMLAELKAEVETSRDAHTFAKDNLDGSADIGAVAMVKYNVNQN